MAVATHN